MVLTAMGVVDHDVVEDYALSAPFMKDIRDRMIMKFDETCEKEGLGEALK
jgi:hypothetical protein